MHKPVTEAELVEMEMSAALEDVGPNTYEANVITLVAEVRRLQEERKGIRRWFMGRGKEIWCEWKAAVESAQTRSKPINCGECKQAKCRCDHEMDNR